MSFSVSRNKPTKDDPYFISRHLDASSAGMAYAISQQLAEIFPDKHIIENINVDFDVRAYADDGLCIMQPKPGVHPHLQTRWFPRDKEFEEQIVNGRFCVEWQNHLFDLLIMTLPGSQRTTRVSWLAAETEALGQQFLREVIFWNSEVRGEVLVFDDDSWDKDARLFEEIKTATLENLVLAPGLKQSLYNDLAQFFASRELYESYGVPWKRGLLLVGPPGNGKTHTVKALINALGKPCLYVKSLSGDKTDTTHNSIRRVFDRARAVAPCIMVLEDLDTLVTDDNRSVFLNEMDGFTSNTGIVTLATSNHPEKLDPALANRPSRFDRKYLFALPALEERRAYLSLWNHTLQPALRLNSTETEEVAAQTEGFSFAYLKELIVSAITAWMAAAQPGTMFGLIVEQAASLRTQMATPPAKRRASKKKRDD